MNQTPQIQFCVAYRAFISLNMQNSIGFIECSFIPLCVANKQRLSMTIFEIYFVIRWCLSVCDALIHIRLNQVKNIFRIAFFVDLFTGISWKSLNASMCRNCGSKTKWSTIDGNRPLNQNTWFLNRWMCVVLRCTTNVCLNDEKWIETLFWSILNAVGNANSKSKGEIKESGENIVNNKIRIHLLNPQSCTLSECVYLTWHRI